MVKLEVGLLGYLNFATSIVRLINRSGPWLFIGRALRDRVTLRES
ncbi:MAG: hypothetical protein AVDCRST_MAG86-4338 [uncultured Truepera sp.]|uniref:Uncharacterized protein n=1 Tax=uncultured Truepera sp. TaxID=543023 RepID=A0A6J4VVD5_9DEIN|nr:MAG: hypothetical protein AVDCRST_MAG86-4338 [uncultured Truepera sp.]